MTMNIFFPSPKLYEFIAQMFKMFDEAYVINKICKSNNNGILNMLSYENYIVLVSCNVVCFKKQMNQIVS